MTTLPPPPRDAVVTSSSSSQDGDSSARYTPDIDEDESYTPSFGAGGEDAYELRNLVSSKHSVAVDGDEEVEHPSIPWARRRESTQSFELYTPDEEGRVRRKLDIRLTLFVAMLYMLSFLDRSNIGNAKVAGLMRDLRLDDNQFEGLLTAFYVTYILFEWMTILYQVFPPHIYIAVCVCAWGVLASCQALTSSFPGLLIIRAMLGVGEAAFVGIPFYLTFFYRREELALRTGLFISAAPLATTFASSLAYAIMGIATRTQIASWRLLFLLEGFPAVVVAVWCWSWLPDSPGQAWWLSARERKVAVLRLRSEKPTRQSHKLSIKEVLRTLGDPKAYLTAAVFFCCNVAFSSMPVFLPTIVESLGFTARSSQALSAPPFLFAFVVVLITALVSDRLKSRSVPLLLHLLTAMLGYLFLALAGIFGLQLTILRYLAVYPICAGFFSAVTLVITWTINNQATDEGKSTSMAILNVIGQCGPLLGTRLYPDSAAPYFVGGMVVCAITMAVAAALVVALRFTLIRDNRRRSSSKNNFLYML
ncbi:hypothetical protein AMS68_004656 [Peltaster fructicola]|uniref:Major facilitator superfamily (MFS) profile domain-containing protein n=1 Tax=Peltaster fructicola TaxID=286661 RepID=A0A6H0XWZ5_9PEZI|nr:hypothetical protein AMS68_004656 [Peltaster fructicola]